MDKTKVVKAFVYGSAALVAYRLLKKLQALGVRKHPGSGSGRLPPDAAIFGRYFQSKATGLWLYRRKWGAVDGQPKGVVFVAHGFGEHSGRYDGVAAELNKHGFVVYSMDHVGHGQSEGIRCHVETFDHYVSDFCQYVANETATIDPALPRFLLGHSMGGAIAIHVAHRTGRLWRGVVLSGPLIAPDPDVATPFMKFVAKTLGSWLPQLQLSSLEPEKICSDPAVVDSYAMDPLNYHAGMRAGMAAATLSAMDFTMDVAAPAFSLPVFIQHGAKDVVCLPSGSQTFLNAITSDDKTISLYPKALHEIYLGVERDVVLKDLSAWLNRRA